VFAVEYRRRHDREISEAMHGSLALELLGTFIPLSIVMVMFTWGASTSTASRDDVGIALRRDTTNDPRTLTPTTWRDALDPRPVRG
jgi:heme/copper-type cytochrome/quinol oxidase subunit 2